VVTKTGVTVKTPSNWNRTGKKNQRIWYIYERS